MNTGEKITLYSTGCPNCKSLATMLDNKGIKYDINESEQAILDLGFSSAPLLQVGNEVLTFYQAIKWVSNYSNNN